MNKQTYCETERKKSLVIGTGRCWSNIKMDLLETDYLLVTNDSAP